MDKRNYDSAEERKNIGDLSKEELQNAYNLFRENLDSALSTADTRKKEDLYHAYNVIKEKLEYSGSKGDSKKEEEVYNAYKFAKENLQLDSSKGKSELMEREGLKSIIDGDFKSRIERIFDRVQLENKPLSQKLAEMDPAVLQEKLESLAHFKEKNQGEVKPQNFQELAELTMWSVREISRMGSLEKKVVELEDRIRVLENERTVKKDLKLQKTESKRLLRQNLVQQAREKLHFLREAERQRKKHVYEDAANKALDSSKQKQEAQFRKKFQKEEKAALADLELQEKKYLKSIKDLNPKLDKVFLQSGFVHSDDDTLLKIDEIKNAAAKAQLKKFHKDPFRKIWELQELCATTAIKPSREDGAPAWERKTVANILNEAQHNLIGRSIFNTRADKDRAEQQLQEAAKAQGDPAFQKLHFVRFFSIIDDDAENIQFDFNSKLGEDKLFQELDLLKDFIQSWEESADDDFKIRH